jgi:hypothetical protein
MTGEMHVTEIREGGDHYEWAQAIRKAAQSLARRTRFALRFKEMKPFDVYQGPYAQMNYGTLWSGEQMDTFYYDGLGLQISGTLDFLADKIREKVSQLQERD